MGVNDVESMVTWEEMFRQCTSTLGVGITVGYVLGAFSVPLLALSVGLVKSAVEFITAKRAKRKEVPQ